MIIHQMIEGAGGKHHRACANRHGDALISARVAVRMLMLGSHYGYADVSQPPAGEVCHLILDTRRQTVACHDHLEKWQLDLDRMFGLN